MQLEAVDGDYAAQREIRYFIVDGKLNLCLSSCEIYSAVRLMLSLLIICCAVCQSKNSVFAEVVAFFLHHRAASCYSNLI